MNEASLLAVFARVLGHPVVPGDDFFDAGGDSLKAVDLMRQIQAMAPIEFPLQLLFDNGSIGDVITECVRLAHRGS